MFVSPPSQLNMGKVLFVASLIPKRKASLFEELGFKGRTLELLKKALTLPNGMLLVTGPTGSGKTTTFYTSQPIQSA